MPRDLFFFFVNLTLFKANFNLGETGILITFYRLKSVRLMYIDFKNYKRENVGLFTQK